MFILETFIHVKANAYREKTHLVKSIGEDITSFIAMNHEPDVTPLIDSSGEMVELNDTLLLAVNKTLNTLINDDHSHDTKHGQQGCVELLPMEKILENANLVSGLMGSECFYEGQFLKTVKKLYRI